MVHATVKTNYDQNATKHYEPTVTHFPTLVMWLIGMNLGNMIYPKYLVDSLRDRERSLTKCIS